MTKACTRSGARARCGSAPSSRRPSSIELLWALTKGGGETGAFSAAAVSSVRTIGRSLFTDYAFAFEVTSVLILVAMVGAVVLARREGGPSAPPSV